MKPSVYDSRGHQLPWDRSRIARTILKETTLATKFYGIDPASVPLAKEIAEAVESKLEVLGVSSIQAPLVRAIMNAELIERGYVDYANLLSRVGTPVYDSHMIDTGGMGRGDNANLQENAETSHKRKADKICKEQYLLQLPKRLANLHRSADIHIHDLEYFGTRPFCQDWDLRYFFYYGLMPDGLGASASVAGPAKKPEVAMLHSVKALGSAQTNFAGGQGYYNFLTFTAPYLEGMSYDQIKQYMQMFVYEMTQMMVARGGQVVFSSVQLSPGVPDLWKEIPVVYKGKVWDGQQAPKRVYGEFEREVRLSFKALMEVMLEGDYWGKPFNFPKPEISIEPCFIKDLDHQLINLSVECEVDEGGELRAVHQTGTEQCPTYRELYLMAFELAAKYGTPYFDNQLPAYRQVNAGGISCYQCCVVADTPFTVIRNGKVQLTTAKDLQVTDKLPTPSGYQRFQEIREIPFDGEVMNITLKGGRNIQVTPDHVLPVLREQKVVEVTASEIQDFDKIRVIASLPTTALLPRPLVAVYPGYDIDLAYLIGLWAAEGSATEHTNGSSKYLGWYFGAKENDLAIKTHGLIQKVFGKNATIHPSFNKQGTEVVLGSKKVFEWFQENNIALKGKLMTVPPWILGGSSAMKSAFLMGYFRGDGCLRKNGTTSPGRRIEMNTISEGLAEGILLLAGSLGYDLHYGKYRDHREGRKDRYILTLNKSGNIRDFLQGAIKMPIDLWLPISKINRSRYTGQVYDPVEVPGHLYCTANGIVNHNCAYQFSSNKESDKKFEDKLHFKDGAHFSMGASQVITLNLPRLAYQAEGDPKRFVQFAKDLMDQCIEIFQIKKQWMDEIRAAGKMPFAMQRPRDPATGTRGATAVDFDSLVYTIGIVGMNEVVQVLTGKQLHESDESVKLAIRLMLELRNYTKKLSKETGLTIAFARTPAETTAQRFAVADLLDPAYTDDACEVVKGNLPSALAKIGESTDLPVYYTNGTHILPSARVHLSQRMSIESKFFPLIDGGNIMHIWLGESAPDPRGLMDMTLNLCNNTNIGYFAFTRDFTVCRRSYRK